MARRERTDFVQRAGSHHRVEPRVDARPENFAVRREEDSRAACRVDEWPPAPRLQSGEAAARGRVDLECAQQPLRIGRAQ